LVVGFDQWYRGKGPQNPLSAIREEFCASVTTLKNSFDVDFYIQDLLKFKKVENEGSTEAGEDDAHYNPGDANC